MPNQDTTASITPHIVPTGLLKLSLEAMGSPLTATLHLFPVRMALRNVSATVGVVAVIGFVVIGLSFKFVVFSSSHLTPLFTFTPRDGLGKELKSFGTICIFNVQTFNEI